MFSSFRLTYNFSEPVFWGYGDKFIKFPKRFGLVAYNEKNLVQRLSFISDMVKSQQQYLYMQSLCIQAFIVGI